MRRTHAIAGVSVTLWVGNSCLENQDLPSLVNAIAFATARSIFAFKLFNILEDI